MKRWLLDFSLSAPGGASTYAEGFLGALAEAGPPSEAEITVLLPRIDGLADLTKKLEKGGIAVEHVNLGCAASWRARVERHLCIPFISWRRHADVVFVPREAAPLLCRGRLVVLGHNVKVWDRRYAVGVRARMTWTVLNLNARLATRRARRVLAVTWTFGMTLPVPAKKVVVVYHGCDLQFPIHRRAAAAKPRILKVVCLGTLSSHKRFDLAILAVSALRRSGHAVELEIWGGPGSAGEAERLSRLGLDVLGSDPVRGVLPPSERGVMLGEADVLFVGSSYESFGLPMVEALRTSTLVLAPSSSLVDELCAGAAVTYTEGDPEDAALSLSGALTHMDSLLADGVERSVTFTWERCVAQTLRELSMIS